ncbi:MAG: glycosyltransferase family 4 protein [Actinomycetota bacterium]
MRIVQACPYDWGAPGGVQVHVRQLAAELRRRGHDVLVVAPGAGGPRDVRIVGRPVRVPYQGTVAPISPWPSTVLRTRRAVAAFKPDLVHAHEPLTPSVGMFATLAARHAGAPVVGTFHAFAESSRLFDVAAPIVRPVWNRLAVRVAVSAAAAGFVRSRMGGPGPGVGDGEVLVVPNGLDVEAFGSAEPAPGLPPGRRLLWVGRLDRQKGFGIALRAFESIVRTHPEALLVVAGEGGDRGLVDAVPRPIRARVVMLGTVPHEELPPYHAAAELFLSPATGQESFGYVLVEAMAAGLPVVASDIPGYREVVRDGVDGLLVRPSDAEALAAAVRTVLDDLDLAGRLSEAGRARARDFSWETVADRLEALYGDATAQP